MINLFIADDHLVLIEGMQSILADQDDMHLLGYALNGQELLQKLHSYPEVDVVLLDVNMPVLDGMETSKELKKRFPDVKIVVLTMHQEKSFIIKTIRNGADGYVLKSSGHEVLMQAIRRVMNRETYFDPQVTSTVMSSLVPGTNLRQQAFIPRLTKREREILNLIVDEFSTQEIAEKLFISNNTVESHRANLLSKLQVKNTAGLVRVALEKELLQA